MSANIKVVLYPSKTLKNGEHPIMLRVIKDRKPKYISIGFSCTKDLWDDKENLPKKKHVHYKELCILISDKLSEAQRMVLDLQNDNKDLSAHEIKGKLKRKVVNNPLIVDYFDNVIKRLIAAGQIKNAEIYKDTKRNLSHFIQSRQLHFSDIDVQFLNSFEEFLKTSGKGSNTIYIYLRTLRALLNKAIKEDVCSEKYYPFKRFSLSKYSKIKTQKRAIEKKDIDKIKNLTLSKHPHLIDARNIFLFSYYCRGMNFIDIASLKWKDIKNNRLSYRRKKTNDLFNMEIFAPAKNILNYYKPLTFSNRESYVFPIFNENHITSQSMHNRRTKMLREVNLRLKEIGQLAKIKTELTTYVARHTYATVLKKGGIPISIIKEAMGHDNEKTTQIYLDSFENKIIDEASKVIL
ncbi:MAG: site-specific integrase [Bacteroidota bacterium]|nr:site-specific integrase [Bacteroidota bacterium]